MSEEPGVSSSEMRSTTSWGISMRSRAALALSGDDTGGVVSTICLPGARHLEGVGGDFSGIDTTVQRSASPSFWNPITVNTCVPSDCSGSWPHKKHEWESGSRGDIAELPGAPPESWCPSGTVGADDGR